MLLVGGTCCAPSSFGKPSREKTTTAEPDLPSMFDEYGWSMRVVAPSQKFVRSVTRNLWEKIPPKTRRCSSALLSAQFAGVKKHALHAAPSFRNCAIRQGRAYLFERVEAFRKHAQARNYGSATQALGEAIASLHAFYAFSNYVELIHARDPYFESVLKELPPVWRAGPLAVDVATIQSDFSANVMPNYCGETKPVLDKRAKSGAGAEQLKPTFTPAHETAVELALRDTQAMLKALFKTEKSYLEHCDSALVLGFLPRSWWP